MRFWHCAILYTGLSIPGALFGLFGGYLVNRWVNRHTIALTGPELTSIAQTIGLNMLLMMVFSGHMDHW